MIYRITVINGRKYATAVKSREEFLALRDSSENLDNLAKARQGDEAAKRNLVQFAYNLGHVDGLIAGCKSIGSFFFHDIDCYDMSDGGSKMADVILSKKDEIGLMMLERSASGGWHLVCKRVPGTTILENQVRVACALKVGDMDNNARDLQRVVFGTSGSAEDLIYLDNSLFDESMTAEFTVEDARRVRLQQGMDAEHTLTMIRNWKSRHFVYQISDISFKKSTLTKKNGTDNSIKCKCKIE